MSDHLQTIAFMLALLNVQLCMIYFGLSAIAKAIRESKK